MEAVRRRAPRTEAPDMAAASLRAVALAKRLQGLEKVRRSFVSDAAHELNTPLTPLRIHVDLLAARTDLTPAQRKHVEVIRRNAIRLCNLVEGLLDVARNEAGRLRLDLSDGPLAEVVEEAVAETAPAAAEAGVQLEVLSPQGPVFAIGDRPAVAKVMRILLSNAIRFAPGGRVAVTVRRSALGSEALVDVTDTGVGLTGAQIGQLFQPFSRPHEAPGPGAGAGLGLVVAKGLVERQGGRLWAESPGPGQGTTFSFTLPREGSPAQPAAAST